MRQETIADFPQDGFLGLDIKVDHHVADKDQVQWWEDGPGLDQIHGPEFDQLFYFVLHAPFLALLGEVFDQVIGRQPAVDFKLGVSPLARRLQDGGRQIGGQNRNGPTRQLRKMFEQQHGQAIRLLARGTSRRPNGQPPRPAPLLQHLRAE